MRVKESPGRAGAFKESLTRTSRDQGALDAPIVSQSANQARRGSYKRPTRRGATHRRVGPGHDGPWARGARHDQLTNATLAARFGTQNCYLAMAAMRPTRRVKRVSATGRDLPSASVRYWCK